MDFDLRAELQTLHSLYSQALELEQALTTIVENKDLARIPANTRKKRELMTKIEAQFRLLEPHLQQETADEESRRLREAARSLLQQLLELEEKNRETILEKQSGYFSEMKHNQSARRFARGYKPSSQRITNPSVDKKG